MNHHFSPKKRYHNFIKNFLNETIVCEMSYDEFLKLFNLKRVYYKRLNGDKCVLGMVGYVSNYKAFVFKMWLENIFKSKIISLKPFTLLMNSDNKRHESTIVTYLDSKYVRSVIRPILKNVENKGTIYTYSILFADQDNTIEKCKNIYFDTMHYLAIESGYSYVGSEIVEVI